MIDASTPVKIYNYGTSDIGIKGQLREYLLLGSRGIPTVLTMPFSEVEYINARTPVFRNGTLQFDPAQQDTIYKALYLENWQNTVLFDQEIDRIIRENDMDSVHKFIDVTDVFTIQRIRGHMISLSNDPDTDISRRMIDLIEGRYDEINHGIRQSKLNVAKAKARMEQDEDPRIRALQAQIEQMKQMISEMQTQATETASAPGTK